MLFKPGFAFFGIFHVFGHKGVHEFFLFNDSHVLTIVFIYGLKRNIIIRLDSLAVDQFSGRCIVTGYGNSHAQIVVKVKGFLHRALAESLFA